MFTNTNINTTTDSSGIYNNTSPDWAITTNTNTLSFSDITISNMEQIKVAVFKVQRDKKGQITSIEFLKEMWVERKNKASLDVIVTKQLVKELKEDFNPEDIVIKSIYTVNF